MSFLPRLIGQNILLRVMRIAPLRKPAKPPPVEREIRSIIWTPQTLKMRLEIRGADWANPQLLPSE